MSQSARRLSHVPTQMPSQRASLAPQPSPGPDPPPDALPDSTPTRLAAPASSASSSRAAPASVLAACGLGYATSALVPDACHVWHQDNDAVRTAGPSTVCQLSIVSRNSGRTTTPGSLLFLGSPGSCTDQRGRPTANSSARKSITITLHRRLRAHRRPISSSKFLFSVRDRTTRIPGRAVRLAHTDCFRDHD